MTASPARRNHAEILYALGQIEVLHGAIVERLDRTLSLTVAEYAEREQVSQTHVYRMLRDGRLPGHRSGAKWFVDEPKPATLRCDEVAGP